MGILDELRSQREQLINDIEGLQSAADFDPSDKTYVEARSKADSIDSKIKSMVEWQKSRDAANEIDALSIQHRNIVEEKQTREMQALTIGEAWTRSKAYADYVQTPRGNSGTITMPFDAVQTRAPILTSTFAGLIQPDRIAPSTAPTAQTPFLDLIGRVQVGSNSVEWVYFPAAAPVGTVTAEGAAKTEAAIAPELRTVTLDTIASWAQYSRQFGEDAPGLVAFLNSSLARGLMDKREALAVAALLADTAIPVTPNTGDLLEGIRVAIAGVQDAGYRPAAAVLNPADYASIDIGLLGATLRGPVVNGQVWGVQIVPVGAVPAGTAYVGDFGVAMVELVRSEVSVYTTDSHASTFTSNVLTTLVECRTKPIVHRAEAVTKVTAGAPVTASAGGRK